MTTLDKVKEAIGTCREKGIDTISTCNAPNWSKEQHEGMLILQANPPDDIRVELKVTHGVCDWTLIRIGERKPEPIHGTKTQDYTLQIAFDMLRTQKEGLLRILGDDNNKEAVEHFHLDGLLSLLDEIQDQAVDKHGIPEKEVFHLTDTPDTINITEQEMEQMIDRRRPIEVFGAYQHFLYYIEVDKLKTEKPWGLTLTNHFMGKLRDCKIETIVSWVQEMSQHNQATLLQYIMKHHSNKW